VPDVALYVEVLVVDPDRIVEAEGNGDEALTVTGRAHEATGDVVTKLRKAGPAPVLRRREQGDPPHVHVRVGALDLQEGGIERGQTARGHRGSQNSSSPIRELARKFAAVCLKF
jgi:hypothetical protein